MNRRKTKLCKYTKVLAASTLIGKFSAMIILHSLLLSSSPSFLHVFCTVSSLLITILQTHDKPVTVKLMFSCEKDD